MTQRGLSARERHTQAAQVTKYNFSLFRYTLDRLLA
jgi:hypothetical protein